MDENISNTNSGHIEDAASLLDEPDLKCRVEYDYRSATLYPTQSWAASFQFDAAEGFGNWQIWLLSRAQKDLRVARRKSPKLFDIIVNKMR